MSNSANVQSWPSRAMQDQCPLVKFWDSTFESTSIEHSESQKLCEYYSFRNSVCDSPGSLRQCIMIVGKLFSNEIFFSEVHDYCKGAVMRFLGFPEPKNFHSGSVVRKLALAFSSFETVLEFKFSVSVVSSSISNCFFKEFEFFKVLGILPQIT